jgi:myo-inositol catabolism protein IolC
MSQICVYAYVSYSNQHVCSISATCAHVHYMQAKTHAHDRLMLLALDNSRLQMENAGRKKKLDAEKQICACSVSRVC